MRVSLKDLACFILVVLVFLALFLGGICCVDRLASPSESTEPERLNLL